MSMKDLDDRLRAVEALAKRTRWYDSRLMLAIATGFFAAIAPLTAWQLKQREIEVAREQHAHAVQMDYFARGTGDKVSARMLRFIAGTANDNIASWARTEEKLANEEVVRQESAAKAFSDKAVEKEKEKVDVTRDLSAAEATMRKISKTNTEEREKAAAKVLELEAKLKEKALEIEETRRKAELAQARADDAVQAVLVASQRVLATGFTLSFSAIEWTKNDDNVIRAWIDPNEPESTWVLDIYTGNAAKWNTKTPFIMVPNRVARPIEVSRLAGKTMRLCQSKQDPWEFDFELRAKLSNGGVYAYGEKNVRLTEARGGQYCRDFRLP